MNIFITGTTGFLGKVFLLDILDKDYDKLNKIYLLIRSKKNINSKQRFNKITSNVFLRDKIIPYLDKICIIDGSLDYQNLGIEENILNKMDIHIIVNNAASVKFNDKMLTAYNNNCKTIVNLLECTKKYFKNLHKMIHVSTFYVTFPKGKEYIIKTDYNDIIKDIDNGLELDEINHKYNFDFANSYVITKYLSEKILDDTEKNFNTYIIRPSIIANSYKFPHPGWNDSLAAYTGFNVSFGTGTIKYVKIDNNKGFSNDKKLNVVPVDYVSQIMRETIFQDCTKKIINAAINNDELLSFGKLKNTLKYYNILDYNAEYVLKDTNIFWLFNFMFDYLYYVFAYYLCLIFDLKSSKKINFICQNLSNINDTFFYYIHNEWDSNVKNIDLDMNYYHNIIVPKGNNKFILKNDLNEYSLIKNSKYSNNISWIYNKYRGTFYTDLTAIILKQTFREMFSDIIIDIEKLIDIIYKNSEENFIICPNHRSYCDFLLMSYILYELKHLGIKLPLVAATSDFEKVPFIGHLFKNLGCFYVDRGKGISESLNKKINCFVNQEENIEFFIEGTRSRTRQTLKYKTGLIKSLQKTGKSFKILPVTFSYEKIPEQEVFTQEILTNIKHPMKIEGLFLWACKRLLKKKSYGNVYVKFSEIIQLEKNSNVDDVCKQICREYQMNSIITYYHFKFPIHNKIEIKNSGLSNNDHSSILEEWICMNQWIFKYIIKNDSTNFWEKEYFDFYDYLHEKDKIIHENNIEYHKKYFKYVNKDIEEILYQLDYCSFNKIDINKLVLGNTMIFFVKKIFEKYKIIDNDLVVNLEKMKMIIYGFFVKKNFDINNLHKTNLEEKYD